MFHSSVGALQVLAAALCAVGFSGFVVIAAIRKRKVGTAINVSLAVASFIVLGAIVHRIASDRAWLIGSCLVLTGIGLTLMAAGALAARYLQGQIDKRGDAFLREWLRRLNGDRG